MQQKLLQPCECRSTFTVGLLICFLHLHFSSESSLDDVASDLKLFQI